MTATTETGDLPTVSAAATETGDLPTVSAAATETGPSSASEPRSESPSPAESLAVTTPPADGHGVVDPGPRPLARLRALRGQGLTAPGGVVLAVLLLAPGVLVDRFLDGSFGLASAVAFVLAVATTAAAVRVRALGTAAVLPPLLFVGAVAALAWSSGNNRGRHELVLDVGTTMALSAPALFLGTALALAVVLGRLVVHLVRR